MFKKCLIFTMLFCMLCSQLFSQDVQDISYVTKVPAEYTRLTFLSPTISDTIYSYNDEDFMELTRPPHRRSYGSRTSFGDMIESAREWVVLPIVASFSEYTLPKDYKTSASSISSSGLNKKYTFVPNDEKIYSLLLGLKMGMMYDRYTTYSSFAVDMFSIIEGNFNFETKFGVDIAFPIYKETISFVVDPYLSLKLVNVNVGEITTTTIFSSGSTLTTTSEANFNQFSFGIGTLLGLKINFTEKCFITLKGGYKFYFANLDYSSSEMYYLGLENLNLSGWEAAVSINFF